MRQAQRLAEWLAAVDPVLEDGVRMAVTAAPAEVSASLATSTRLHFVGRLAHDKLASLWARSRAVASSKGWWSRRTK